MTQSDVDRAVARATGETVRTIRSLGFSLVDMPEPEPLIVDWDELDKQRVSVVPQCAPRPRALAA